MSSFPNLPARNSPKENSGANGKFLPKPLLFHLRHPNSKKISRVFCEILSPKNSFCKTESALVPPPARILGGQNTKEKCPFLFRRNWSRANPKSKEHFSLVSAEALRGGGGTVHSRSKKVRANAKITPPNLISIRIDQARATASQSLGNPERKTPFPFSKVAGEH